MKKSKNEELFEEFLNNNHIKYEYQYKIKVSFTERGYHKVDFYLPEYDLYIEIKGLMTYYAVNVLKYLLYHSNKNFYILQMTEEDWIEIYNKEKYKTRGNKCKLNIETQFNEILQLKNNELMLNDLSDISKKRLNDYINLRNEDIENWLK